MDEMLDLIKKYEDKLFDKGILKNRTWHFVEVVIYTDWSGHIQNRDTIYINFKSKDDLREQLEALINE